MDLSGLSPNFGGIVNVFTGTVMFWIMFFIFLIVLFVIFGAAFYYWFFIYTIRVDVIEQVGSGGYKRKGDRARFIRKRGEEGAPCIKLLMHNIITDPPNNDIYGWSRAARHLFLSKVGDDLIPASVTWNSPANLCFQNEYQKRLIWLNIKKRIDKKYDMSNWFQRNQMLISVLLILSMVFIILVVTFQYQSKIVSSSTAAADALRESIGGLKDLIRR